MHILVPKYVQKITAIFLLCVTYVVLYKILIPRVTAFGCFDDCFNYVGGYFLLHHKKLFSEIFFNHMPLMAYASMLIQWATHPQNIYELVLRHRQALLFVGFFSEVLLTLRFGIKILPFALLYEFTKFYLFGDRFLAEGFIVYPLVYMFGIYCEQTTQKVKQARDSFVAAFTTWIVIFSREPYALAALFLYGLILFGIKKKQTIIGSLVFFLGLSAITISVQNISDFIFNVITINFNSVATESGQTHIFSIDAYKIFLYPLILLFQNNFSFFGKIEFVFALMFVALSGYFLWKKKYIFVGTIWILLGLTNLRFISPGTVFYAAFHLLPWYALCLAAIVFFLSTIISTQIKLFAVFAAILLGTFLFIFSKDSYIHDVINQQNELITNFGIPMQVGNVIHALSQPTDSLFLDGSDDIIYFVAKRYSPYKYSWYTSLMPDFPVYLHARIVMFRKNPPDFYYGNCPTETRKQYLLPSFVKNDYIRLYNQKKPSCLWVKKSKLPSISQLQWQKASEQLYYLHIQS